VRSIYASASALVRYPLSLRKLLGEYCKSFQCVGLKLLAERAWIDSLTLRFTRAVNASFLDVMYLTEDILWLLRVRHVAYRLGVSQKRKTEHL